MRFKSKTLKASQPKLQRKANSANFPNSVDSLDALLAAANITPLAPPGDGEFTTEEAARRMGVNRCTAAIKLMRAVAEGKLVTREARVSGKVGRVWSKA